MGLDGVNACSEAVYSARHCTALHCTIRPMHPGALMTTQWRRPSSMPPLDWPAPSCPLHPQLHHQLPSPRCQVRRFPLATPSTPVHGGRPDDLSAAPVSSCSTDPWTAMLQDTAPSSTACVVCDCAHARHGTLPAPGRSCSTTSSISPAALAQTYVQDRGWRVSSAACVNPAARACPSLCRRGHGGDEVRMAELPLIAPPAHVSS